LSPQIVGCIARDIVCQYGQIKSSADVVEHVRAFGEAHQERIFHRASQLADELSIIHGVPLDDRTNVPCPINTSEQSSHLLLQTDSTGGFNDFDDVVLYHPSDDFDVPTNENQDDSDKVATIATLAIVEQAEPIQEVAKRPLTIREQRQEANSRLYPEADDF